MYKNLGWILGNILDGDSYIFFVFWYLVFMLGIFWYLVDFGIIFFVLWEFKIFNCLLIVVLLGRKNRKIS